MEKTNTLPLLYDFTEAVLLADQKHVALIKVAGKALVEEDPSDRETSIMAINPGGFWGLGESFEEAWPKFYDTLKSIFSDLASSSDTPAAFEKQVKTLLAPAHTGLQEDWRNAETARKNGDVEAHGLPINEDYGKRGIEISFLSVQPEIQADSLTRSPQIAA